MKNFLVVFLFVLIANVINAEIITEKVEYFHGEQKLIGYLAYDNSIQEKRPGILVIHEWMGLNDYAKKRAVDIAKLGFVGFAIDIYGDGRVLKDRKEAGKTSNIYKSDRKLMRERALAGLNTLKKQKFVDPLKTASIGYCFGGTTALELARSGADILGTVSFHGNLATPDKEDAKNIKGRVLILHGADDAIVPLSEVNDFEKEMKDGNVDYDLIKYSKAVHAFTNPANGERYNHHAATHSWKAMKILFEDIFEDKNNEVKEKK